MKILKVANTDEAVENGFKQLIESKKNGEYAVWEIGTYIATTDDVPDNLDSIDYDEVIRLIQVAAGKRRKNYKKQEENNIRIVEVEKGHTEEGFDQLIESKKNGEYAVWEYGGYITTTDDVPKKIDSIGIDEATRLMKVGAIERREKLEAAKGIKQIYAKVIKVEKGHAEEGFDQLIECKKKGEKAVWEYGGYITTTDDVPDNFESIDYDEVVRLMKVAAIERREKLEEEQENGKQK